MFAGVVVNVAVLFEIEDVSIPKKISCFKQIDKSSLDILFDYIILFLYDYLR